MVKKTDRVTISVLVSTYNRAHFLTECLNSILQQSYAPDEIIVVDDGSSDQTPAIVAGYGNRILYLRQDNQGKAAALNFALPRVTSTHVCFFDDDDVMLPDGLALHVDRLLRDTSADYSYSANFSYDDDSGPSIWDRSRWRTLGNNQSATPETLFVKTLEWNESLLTYLQGMLIPVHCVTEVGSFNPALLRGQDYEMMLKLARRYRGVSTAGPTFVMRDHGDDRGPATQRHAETERMQIWSQYSRITLTRYFEMLPLSEYLPNGPATVRDEQLTSEQRFDALLQRAQIMFSRGYFAQALEDVDSLAVDRPLSNLELERIRNLIRTASNLRNRQFLSKAPEFARCLTLERFSSEERKTIMTAAWFSLCRSFARFSRRKEPVNAAYLLHALSVLTLRRLRIAR